MPPVLWVSHAGVARQGWKNRLEFGDWLDLSQAQIGASPARAAPER